MFLIGVPWNESNAAGGLFGTKLVLNEFVAFIDLGAMGPEVLSDRSRASEAWLNVLNGTPGTPMGPQLAPAGTRAELTQQLRDLFAAGCDRGRYPRGKAAAPDVPDGDARCGAQLK
jgi:hypothetical protein